MSEHRKTISVRCPNCSHGIEMVERPEWLLTEFKGRFGRILARLIKGRRDGEVVTMRALCRAAYPGRWDEVPDNASQIVSVYIYGQREKLNRLGWHIAIPRYTKREGYHLLPLAPEEETKDYQV